jgi:hypothetical protein
MAKRPKRARTERRKADRAKDKLALAARRLHELEPGGSPERPIPLASASVVDVDATGRRCGVCGSDVRLEDHEVIEHQGSRLRAARTRCKQCGAVWRWFYRVAAPN